MSESTTIHGIEAEEWAGAIGEKWLANVDQFESMIGPAGSALMEHCGFAAGERVVDIGCGAAATTIEIARSVGPRGEALGIDISPVLIREARHRAQVAALGNVRFLTADAAAARPEGAPFDRLFSRFGSMFFADFAAAFANLHRMLRPGGRADLAVWAPATENAWVLGMQKIVSRHVELPPPVPQAPGPFALDDPDFVRSLLLDAGFKSVEFTLWRGEQLVGGAGSTPEAAANFALNAMSFADVLQQKPDASAAARHELIELFAGYSASGGVRMPAAAWFVSTVA